MSSSLKNNKLEAQRILIAAREKKYTQKEMAKILADRLGQGYSERQYQKLEAGDFPKYKKKIIEEIDKILDTNIFGLIYEQNVPRETLGLNTPLDVGSLNLTVKDFLNEKEARRLDAERMAAQMQDDKKLLYDIIKTNLVSLEKMSNSTLAHLKAIVEDSAERDSQGDPQRKNDLMAKINNRIAVHSGLASEKGTHAGDGKERTAKK